MQNEHLPAWTEVVRLHPDVESGNLTEAVFAIDLGAIAAGDPQVPLVNRDPEAFFRATYLTADLRKLLEEVLACLVGKGDYNRVLKLRTPFGGGKSHTLAALFHAARQPDALKVLPEGEDLLARVGGKLPPVAVAVFDGEKFDARQGKTLEDGKTIRTMWGWIAWQIDPERAFPLVAGHDKDLVAPGGDVIREMLTRGAGGRPVLILLDEVLKYMERAGAVSVLDSTLQRQAKDFFQNLTVEVAGSTNAALVYSLTWSARESLDNVGLLEEIDKLGSRVDDLREPVSGDEILPVLKRRLLAGEPTEHWAREVAHAYAEVVTKGRRAFSEKGELDRREAEEEGRALRDRLRISYPFHPMLIDLMRERWTAVDAFQRTRGALRFLASCLHSLKKGKWRARGVLGPGDVPLNDVEVRTKLLKELGAQYEYDAVITADIEGPNARAKRIDERLAEHLEESEKIQPATRIATAILLYSFGGLRRESDSGSEPLPPGVTEAELLAACVGPDLDMLTARQVLAELRNKCLYLHYDGARYCFKKDPNVTKLIEDEVQSVDEEEHEARGEGPVRSKIRAMLEERLAGQAAAIVWPTRCHEIRDGEPRFLVAYLPLEFAEETPEQQKRKALEYLTMCGEKPRRYRNGLGLAIPEKKHIEALRRAVRYLVAIERIEARRKAHNLTATQLEQLRERKRLEETTADTSLRELYEAVWLLQMENGEPTLDKREKGGTPLQAKQVHARVMELLTSCGTPKVYGSVVPRKIVERMRLGQPRAEGEPPVMGVRVADVVEAFFRDLVPPRLESGEVLRKAIARGVAEGAFGYVSGVTPELGPDGKFLVNRERVVIGRPLAEDEVDFETGFLMMPEAIPAAATGTAEVAAGGGAVEAGGGAAPCVHEPAVAVGGPGVGAPAATARGGQAKTRIVLTFDATREHVYKAFEAVANLADMSDNGKVQLRIEGTCQTGFDPTRLRNAVYEPLDEANIEYRLEES